jgi:colanic acid/amylovoran biosynthesis glycosyltransferase
VKVAYLVNQYPRVSHTFIRREIIALEENGMDIVRFAIRPPAEPLVDEADQDEMRRTRVVLGLGALGLLRATLRSALRTPRAFIHALLLAIRIGRRSGRGLLVHFIYMAEACVLKDWLVECEAQHLHTHFGTNPTAVAMLCRILGGPTYSFTVHGSDEFDAPRALSLGEKVRHAAFVVAISEFGRSQLYRWSAHADWEKIRVVHCGVDASFLDGDPAPISDIHRLVCVGRLAEQKGHLVLVEAVAQLRDRDIPCELVLVGDGPMRGEIVRLSTRLDLGNRVRLAGSMDGAGVRREILAARALVLPSFAEGLPVVLMEALALGRPVISTYIAGIPELVHPGINGWLVPAGSVEALAEAMQRALAADVVDLERMGHAGAATVAEKHSSITEAGKLARLIMK